MAFFSADAPACRRRGKRAKRTGSIVKSREKARLRGRGIWQRRRRRGRRERRGTWRNRRDVRKPDRGPTTPLKRRHRQAENERPQPKAPPGAKEGAIGRYIAARRSVAPSGALGFAPASTGLRPWLPSDRPYGATHAWTPANSRKPRQGRKMAATGASPWYPPGDNPKPRQGRQTVATGARRRQGRIARFSAFAKRSSLNSLDRTQP